MQEYKFAIRPVKITAPSEEHAKELAISGLRVYPMQDVVDACQPTQMDCPKGERSWLETFSEIHNRCWNWLFGGTGVVSQIQENEGRFGVLDQIIDWTNEFEQKYKDEDWIERDWIETVEQFINEKNQVQ